MQNFIQSLFLRNIPVERCRNTGIVVWLFILVLNLLVLAPCWAQVNDTEEDNSQKMALKVFAEGGISRDYMKREIRFVNYVRDPRMADVYILVTSQSTGSGGTIYTLSYQGQNKYKGIDDTLEFIRDKTDTNEISRRGLIKVIKQGLMRYVATTPSINDLSILYKPSVEQITPKADKWKKWVFNLGFDIELDGEKYEKDHNFDINFSAAKITENWKFTSSFSFNYNEDRFEHEDHIIKDIRKRPRFRTLLARKIGEHWGIGLNAYLNSDVQYNNKLSAELTPSIEYNIYPYSEFSRKQFPVRLGVTFSHRDYYEETIYNKTSELLCKVYMSAAYVINGKWGSIINVLDASFYTQDFNKNNFGLVNIFNFRLFKGFSVNTLIVANLIHDQLYLGKGNLTIEEVLLHRKEIKSSYNYYISLGFNYSFGSMFQNIVNPRFGY